MFYEIKLKVEKENSKGEMKEVIEHFITDVGLFAEADPGTWSSTIRRKELRGEISHKCFRWYRQWFKRESGISRV